MPLLRWLKHVVRSPRAVDRAFPQASLERIAQAIADTETTHGGEIRFAVEASLPFSYLRRDAPVRERAEMIFAKMRVWDTEQNNGALIYVELADHRIEIVADRGIARHVTPGEWEAIAAAMREQFRQGHFEAGVIEAVRRVGALMTLHFPLAGDGRNPNELPDRPAVIGR